MGQMQTTQRDRDRVTAGTELVPRAQRVPVSALHVQAAMNC